MSTQPTTAPKKARTLDEILAEFGPVDQVVFEPIELESHKDAQALLPATFSSQSHPYDYFALFFTLELVQLITTHTNQYAAMQRLHKNQERQREWNNLIADELYVFIGALIYMGVHHEPNISMYWNTDKNKGPIHAISQHLSLRRYEQIKRFCHISDSERDSREGFNLPTNKKWWYKLEPLASRLQASFQVYYAPSSEVSIDEIMVRCFGRLVLITLLIYMHTN
jgi:hypothetical protein